MVDLQDTSQVNLCTLSNLVVKTADAEKELKAAHRIQNTGQKEFRLKKSSTTILRTSIHER